MLTVLRAPRMDFHREERRQAGRNQLWRYVVLLQKLHTADTLERYINILGILNFGFTLQCGWETVGGTLYIIFANGGPSVLVYGTILSIVGHTAIAMSLGEMASMDPTVGAQYRWSAKFAKRWPEFWGLMQGEFSRAVFVRTRGWFGLD